MLGRRSPQRELFRPDNLLLDHVGKDSFFGFLAREGPRLFRDEDYADLYGDRGRPSVPPSQMCVLIALQAKEGVSDQEAVDRTAFDIRWKVALGIDIEEKLCAKSTLQLFRAQLLLNDRFLRLFETSVRACRARSKKGSKKLEVAIDSTPIFGRGAVKDTYNLVSDAIRKVLELAGELKGRDVEQVAGESGLDRHFGTSFKGQAELDWTDQEARRALLAQLVGDAQVALEVGKRALRGYRREDVKTRELREAMELLSKILAQDIDEDPEDGGGAQIKQGTSKDRILSTTDPEMRHGHKSKSKGFDGYKASIVVDSKSGVILSTGVQAGNKADREPAIELVEEARRTSNAEIDTVLGDTAYGDTKTRQALSDLGIDVIAKTPPIPTKGGTFKRDRFRIDEQRGEAVCPAGKRSIRRSRTREDNGWSYFFSRRDCSDCPLRSQCTTSKIRARTIGVLDDASERDRLRKAQKTKRFKRRYRRRVIVEHAFARLRRHGIRQAKYFGRDKTALQIAIAAMAANLSLLAAQDAGSPSLAGLTRWIAVRISWYASVIRHGHCSALSAEGALCRPDL